MVNVNGGPIDWGDKVYQGVQNLGQRERPPSRDGSELRQSLMFPFEQVRGSRGHSLGEKSGSFQIDLPEAV